MDNEIKKLAKIFESLDKENRMEASLTILHLLLPFTFQLEQLKDDPKLKNIYADFFKFVEQLRDGLLG